MDPPTRRLRARPDEYDLALVERAPLPPHERSWRHPSEVAADARRELVAERPSTTARTAALTGGTATILLVGIVVLSLTPRGSVAPTAMSSSPVQRIASASLSGGTSTTVTVTVTTPAPRSLDGRSNSLSSTVPGASVSPARPAATTPDGRNAEPAPTGSPGRDPDPDPSPNGETAPASPSDAPDPPIDTGSGTGTDTGTDAETGRDRTTGTDTDANTSTDTSTDTGTDPGTAGTAPDAARTTEIAGNRVPGTATGSDTGSAPPKTSRPTARPATGEEPPLAIEVGSQGLAVLPSQALPAGHDGTATVIVVLLHSGSVATATVVDAGHGHGLAVVHIVDTIERVDTGYQQDRPFEIATAIPHDTEVVTVMTSEPFTVEFGGIGSVLVDVIDGTAVLDADGSLIGLYIDGHTPGGGRLIPVDVALADAIATPG